MPNSTSNATPVPCQQCKKIMSLRKHEKKVQQVQKIILPPPPQTVCNECLESFQSLSEAREHVELAHEMTFNSHCIDCHAKFLTAVTYQKKRFAEEARLASLGWYRDELFRCPDGKRVQS